MSLNILCILFYILHFIFCILQAASKVELQVESESEYETDTDEEDEEEEVIRPVFIPKAKRETIKEQELKMEQMKIRDEKKLIQEEDRKRQVLRLSNMKYLLYILS